MRFLVGFGRFWYEFIVGDDWRIAAGVTLVLAVGAVVEAAGLGGAWLPPALAVGFAGRLRAAADRRRPAVDDRGRRGSRPRQPAAPGGSGQPRLTGGRRSAHDLNAACDPSSMHGTLFDAVGGMDGVRRLAGAWHERVMADEVVSHAFRHGFHPEHTERLAAYWAEALGGPSGLLGHATATRRRSFACTAATANTTRWTGARSPASTRRLPTSASPATTGCARCCTTTSRGRRPPRWPDIRELADDVPNGLPIPRWSWDGLVE